MRSGHPLTLGWVFASIGVMGGDKRMYEWRLRLAAGLLALGLLLAAATGAQASIYWGATISGEPYGQTGNAPTNTAAWALFERHAGKNVGVLNTGQSWVSFDQAAVDATWAHGAIPVVTMGLGDGVTLASIVAGQHDTAIRNWAKAAKAWAHPFFFAPWWEMNGAWYSWGRSPDYVAAWRHFHDLVVAEGASNVTWTWVPNSIWSDPGSDPRPYYPGDAYVDWAGLDSYNWGRNPAQPDRWLNPSQTIDPTLDLIEDVAPSKPFMVLESASSEYGGNKTDWIHEMLTTYLPHHPEIDAYLWFNWNFPKESARADWQIESSLSAQQAFREGIQNGIYRAPSLVLPALTKVPPPSPPSGGDAASALDLSDGGEVVGGPEVVVGPDGVATVVWSARKGAEFAVYARRIGADGVPEDSVRTLSEPGEDALAPQIALAPDGTATVVWTRFDGANFVVQARRILPDGSLGPAALNYSGSGQDAAAPRVAVDADGVATIVWKRFTGSHYLVQERRMAADGSREASGHILSDSTQDAVEPEVATGPDGEATVVWNRFDGADTIVQARRVEADGSSGASTLSLSAADENAVSPQLVVDEDGVATVVWTRSDGADSIVQARRIDAGGVAEPVANLSAAGRSAAEPRIALGPNGEAIAVWTRFDGANLVIQSRRIAADGTPGNTLTLSAGGGDAAEPEVAVAPDGAATVAWSRFDGTRFVAQRRGITAADQLEAATANVSAAGRGASEPRLAIDGEGILTTIWKRFDGASDVVQGSMALPPPPPPPPTPGVPGGGSAPAGSQPAGSGSGSGAAVGDSFSIGKPRLDRKRGLARLPVTVPVAGRLSLSGGGAARPVWASGTVTMQVRVRGAKKRLLQRRGVLAVEVTVTFVSDEGAVSSQSVTVKLRKS